MGVCTMCVQFAEGVGRAGSERRLYLLVGDEV